MTKKMKKVVKPAESSSAESTGKCACGCDNCKCGCGGSGLAIAALAGTALAIVLSVAAYISCNHIDDKIASYIKENPKLILDSVNEYIEKEEGGEGAEAQGPRMADANLVAKVVADKTNYSLGNPKGKYVIIEFFDYNCGWCQRTNAALKDALKKPEAKNIRWIPIDTPIFGASSETIAQYVLAAGKQGKYETLHDAVATGHDKLAEARGKVGELVREFMSKNNLTDSRDPKVIEYSNKVSVQEYSKAMEAIAKDLKLNVATLKKDAHSSEIKGKLAANREYSRALRINGVPMLIVNGRINEGALLGEALNAAVAESAK